MGDADDNYDFGKVPNFVEKLRQGYDLVMGNRFKGKIKPVGMPKLHKYFGNPALSWLLNFSLWGPSRRLLLWHARC